MPRLLGWPKQRIQARVEELLDLIGLPAASYARRLPAELSGGERQRVGVARALGADPNILLMDEPFGAIDPIARERLQNELLRLQRVVRKTIVFVTHDIDEAVKLGDRVALLSKGGVLEQFATPEELLAHPQSEFVTGFLGEGPLVRRLALIPIAEVELARRERRRTGNVGGLRGNPCAMRSMPCFDRPTDALGWSRATRPSASSTPTSFVRHR